MLENCQDLSRTSYSEPSAQFWVSAFVLVAEMSFFSTSSITWLKTSFWLKKINHFHLLLKIYTSWKDPNTELTFSRVLCFTSLFIHQHVFLFAQKSPAAFSWHSMQTGRYRRRVLDSVFRSAPAHPAVAPFTQWPPGAWENASSELLSCSISLDRRVVIQGVPDSPSTGDGQLRNQQVPLCVWLYPCTSAACRAANRMH